MKEKKSLHVTEHDYEWHPRFIEIAACLFVASLMLTSILAPKIFLFGPFAFSAAILVYPLCCIFGDILTEVYGFNRTRRIIWMGMICNILLVVTTTIAVALPPAPDFKLQGAFASIHGQMPRIVIASFTAYLVSELINSFIMSRMKIWQKARHFWMRAIASTAGSQIVDSIIFFVMAFGGVLPISLITNLILSSWMLKMLYEIVTLPGTYLFMIKLKTNEGIEHFDKQKLHLLKF